MAKNAVSDWSETASENTDVGGINIAEGSLARDINNAQREMMAQLAKETASLRTNLGAVFLDGFTNLRALSRASGQSRVFLKYGGADNDGLGGVFIYDSTDASSADDGVSVIVATDGSRWKRAHAPMAAGGALTLAGAASLVASSVYPTGSVIPASGHTVAGDGGQALLYATGATDATYPGGGSLKPLDRVVTPAMFGAVGDEATDDSAAIQAMLDFSGANRVPFLITQDHLIASALKLKYHAMVGRCIQSGSLKYTGSGAAIRSELIGGIYPVSSNLDFTVELTAASQYGWDFKLSYSRARLLLTMSAAACTDCAGMRLMGDASGGSGSYYNQIILRGQADHQTNTHLLRTLPDSEDFSDSRGPNANHVYIERAGQYNSAVVDQVGGGNRIEFQTIEAASSATSTAVSVGNPNNALYLSTNEYIIQYSENVDTMFAKLASTYSNGSFRLDVQYASGGQAVDDPDGWLRQTSGVIGWHHKTSSTQPFEIEGSAPEIKGAGFAQILMTDTTASKTLKITNSAGFAESTHAFRLYKDTTEFLRAGTSGLYPATDSARALGSSSQRWSAVYATTLYPGSGGVKWTSGSGTPESSVTAPVGSLYTRTDGGASTTLYVKESGTGNTGWVAK